MPSQGFASSPLANAVATRSRLSAVRQKLGMEQSGQNQMGPQGGVRPIQPQPGPAPAAVVSPQAQAVMGQPAPGALRAAPTSLEGLHVPQQGSGEPFQYQHPPGQLEHMQAMAANYLKTQPKDTSAPATPSKPPVGGGNAAPAGSSNPIAQFYATMKRLPNPHELAVIGAHQKLSEGLGRPPTQQEIQQYFKPGAPAPAEGQK